MPLMLDAMRAEFARHLAEQPGARFSMDKALIHVLALAYAAGMQEAKVSGGETAAEVICASCQGSGESGYYLAETGEPIICKPCRGSGIIETGEPIICKPCRGSGIIETPDAPAAIQLARDLLDPERFGHATTHEVRQAARRALGRI